jgi:predicted fused transcriptional regulator/phosphomethylpyrimidine kinase
MRKFITPDRNKGHLMPASIDAWLPEKHLARFVVEILDQLDLRACLNLAFEPTVSKFYSERGAKRELSLS